MRNLQAFSFMNYSRYLPHRTGLSTTVIRSVTKLGAKMIDTTLLLRLLSKVPYKNNQGVSLLCSLLFSTQNTIGATRIGVHTITGLHGMVDWTQVFLKMCTLLSAFVKTWTGLDRTRPKVNSSRRPLNTRN